MNQEEIDKLNRAMEPIVKKINQIISTEFRSPSYRYFQDKKKNMYFWTTEPVIKDGFKRFASGIYRYRKTRKQWILTKKIYHAKRNKAKARALKLYNKAMEKND